MARPVADRPQAGWRSWRPSGKRIALAATAVAGAFIFWLFAVWPPPSWYRTHWPRETAFMHRMRSRAVPPGFPATPQYRPVPLDSVSRAFLNAVVTGEDARFWQHGGIDFVELRRAMGYGRREFSIGAGRDRADLVRGIQRARKRRGGIRGASTITQQLAKNLYLSPSRSPLRKLKEAVTAVRLESALGKHRILELYVNVAEFGPNVWGVGAATDFYFRRSPAAISRQQAAALAATLPFPSSSNALYRPARMRQRQALILRRMRGEAVEIPPVPDVELPARPGDTIIRTPSMDSLLDSLRSPVETLPPAEPFPYELPK